MLLFGFLCPAIGIQCNLFAPSYWNTVQCYFFCFFAQLSEYNVTYLSQAFRVQCNLFGPSYRNSYLYNVHCTMLLLRFLCQAIGIQCYLLGFFAKQLEYNAIFWVSLQSYWHIWSMLSDYNATFLDSLLSYPNTVLLFKFMMG